MHSLDRAMDMIYWYAGLAITSVITPVALKTKLNNSLGVKQLSPRAHHTNNHGHIVTESLVHHITLVTLMNHAFMNCHQTYWKENRKSELWTNSSNCTTAIKEESTNTHLTISTLLIYLRITRCSCNCEPHEHRTLTVNSRFAKQ